MQVVFRVDASNRIGTGHVTRCLTLANCLRAKGAECRFVHRLHPGNMADAIRRRRYPVSELPSPVSTEPAADADYEQWLGVSQAQDAEQTIKALDGINADWIVVDHYSLDISWEEAIRPQTQHIAVIDDLANRRHDCDLLVDQNYFPDAESRYHGLVPDRAKRLCGPRYSLLRPEYAQARRFIGPRRGPLSRVLVYYGGTDPSNETARALRVLSRPEFSHLAVDLVIGVNNPNRKTLTKQARQRPLTDVHGPREHLVDLMIEADLAIGAGGSTTWERCTLGLPSIVTTVTQDQIPFNNALAKKGFIYYIGHWSSCSDVDLITALGYYLRQTTEIWQTARQAWHVTDGLGALRVAEFISPSDRETLELRAYPSYNANQTPSTDSIFSIRNSAARLQSDTGSKNSVNFADTDGSRDLHARFLLTPEGLPVGEMHPAANENVLTLHYAVDPDFKHLGWAEHMLDLAVDSLDHPLDTRSEQGELWGTRTETSKYYLRLPHVENVNPEPQTSPFLLTVLSDPESWLNQLIPSLLTNWLIDGHSVRWVHSPDQLQNGDFCFLLSCSQRVRPELLRFHKHNLVVHESDLPNGRGWSPLSWQVLEGATRIPVTLLEASTQLDAGDIYLQQWIELHGDELIDELRLKQAEHTFDLCRQFVTSYPSVAKNRRPQHGEPTWFRRRSPEDSRLDPTQSIRKQFNLLRIVDNQHYPAFFCLNNRRFILTISCERPVE